MIALLSFIVLLLTCGVVVTIVELKTIVDLLILIEQELRKARLK